MGTFSRRGRANSPASDNPGNNAALAQLQEQVKALEALCKTQQQEIELLQRDVAKLQKRVSGTPLAVNRPKGTGIFRKPLGIVKTPLRIAPETRPNG